jgi:hypothetical protein
MSRNNQTELKETALKLHEAGVPLTEICRTVNKSKRTIYRWFKEQGVKTSTEKKDDTAVAEIKSTKLSAGTIQDILKSNPKALKELSFEMADDIMQQWRATTKRVIAGKNVSDQQKLLQMFCQITGLGSNPNSTRQSIDINVLNNYKPRRVLPKDKVIDVEVENDG